MFSLVISRSTVPFGKEKTSEDFLCVSPAQNIRIRIPLKNCEARDLVVEEKEHFKRYKQDQVKDTAASVCFYPEGFCSTLAMKNTLRFRVYVGDEKPIRLCGDYFINHCKDPYETTNISWKPYPATMSSNSCVQI